MLTFSPSVVFAVFLTSRLWPMSSRPQRMSAVKCMWKQARQCTYNVTLRRARATIVAVEKGKVLHILSVCVCSLRYLACNAHAPDYHLWPATLYNIFPHFLKNDFRKTLLNTKCVFWFSLQLLSETFLIVRRTERNMILKTETSSVYDCTVEDVELRYSHILFFCEEH